MGPWRIGTHGRVLAVLAAALCAALAAPAAAPAAKAKPCKHGQVRKKGRCVKKPKKAKPAAPRPTGSPSPVPNTPAPSSAGPAVLDTIGFNNLLTGTRLYRKEGQRLETWDFCPSGPLHYHGEIPQGDTIAVTDWQGEWFYSLNAYS